MHALLFCTLFHVISNSASASPSRNEETDQQPESRETGREPDSEKIISQSQYERGSDPASPLFDDGGRLRLEFLRPGNRSLTNFRLPLEVPVEDDPEVRLTSGSEPQDETTTKKSAGFFKGIGDFFKHSFHMDKTTLPVQRTTTSPEDSVLEPSLGAGSRFDEAIVGRGRGRGISFFRNKQKGREATFNFRIKAVALPK